MNLISMYIPIFIFTILNIVIVTSGFLITRKYVRSYYEKMEDKIRHLDHAKTMAILESTPDMPDRVFSTFEKIFEKIHKVDREFAMREARRLYGLEPLSRVPIEYKIRGTMSENVFIPILIEEKRKSRKELPMLHIEIHVPEFIPQKRVDEENDSSRGYVIIQL